MKTNTLKKGITIILAGYLSFGIASGQGDFMNTFRKK